MLARSKIKAKGRSCHIGAQAHIKISSYHEISYKNTMTRSHQGDQNVAEVELDGASLQMHHAFTYPLEDI
jgi:hypothetical protein